MAEVASAVVTLLPSFKGGGAKIGAQLGGPLEKSGRIGGKRFGDGMKSGIGAIGGKVFAPLAAAAAAVGIGGFFKDAIAGASDLNETTTKVQAIFGKGTDAVQKFANSGAKALGQSKQQVLDASATFGTFGKAAGLGGKDLAKFSTDFAGLSTDMASFSNTSPEQAVEAIGAALRGESEPIRQYGVLLDDATLRSEALGLGLIKTTKQALTPQQKVLAAQAAIWKQTSDAQGDFSKTSGGLANQQRILAAQFTDLKATIGSALLPIAVKAITIFNGLFDQLKTGKGVIGSIAGAVQVFFAALSGEEVTALGPLGKVGEVAYAIRDGFLAALPSIKEFVKGGLANLTEVGGKVFDALKPVFAQLPGLFAKVLPVISSVIGVILSVIGTLASKLAPIFTVVMRVISDVVGLVGPLVVQLAPMIGAFINSLGGVVTTLVEAFGKVWPSIQRLIAGILTQLVPGLRAIFAVITTQVVPAVQGFIAAIAPLVSWLIDRLGPIVVTVFGVVIKVIKGAFQIIAGIFKLVTAVIKGDWQGAWDAFKSILSAAWGIIKAVVVGAFNILKAVFNNGLAVMKAIWTRVWGAIKAVARVIWNAIVSVIKAAWTKLKNTVTVGINAVKSVLSAAWSVIKSVASAAWNAIKSVVSAVWTRIKSIVSTGIQSVKTAINGLRTIATTIGGFFQKAYDAVKKKIGSIVTFVGGLPEKIVGALGDMGSTLYEAGKSVISGLLNGIRDAVQGVLDFAGGIASRIRDVKGPESKDKKLLVPAGKQIIGGLRKGLEAEYGSVTASLDGFTKNLSLRGGRVSLPSNTGVAGGRAAGGAQYTVNYENVYVTSVEELLRKSETKLGDLVAMSGIRVGVA